MNKKIHTHYDNLKVARNAPPEVIKAAYKVLTQKHHPDKNPGSAESVRIMSVINTSYEILMDQDKRRLHDLWIKQQEEVGDNDYKNNASKNQSAPHYNQSYAGTSAHTGNQWENYETRFKANQKPVDKKSSTVSGLIAAAKRNPFVTSLAVVIALSVFFKRDEPKKSTPLVQTDVIANTPKASSGDALDIDSQIQTAATKKLTKQLWGQLHSTMSLRDVLALLGKPKDTSKIKEGELILFYSNDKVHGPYVYLKNEKLYLWGVAKNYFFGDKSLPPAKPALVAKEQIESQSIAKKTCSSSDTNGILPGESFSGYIPGRPIRNNDGRSEFTVDNTRISKDVLVKLVEVGSTTAARTFQVKANSKFTVRNLRAGSYKLMHRHRGSCRSSVADDTFDVEEVSEERGIRYSIMSVTLYEVQGGNLQMDDMSASAFDNY